MQRGNGGAGSGELLVGNGHDNGQQGTGKLQPELEAECLQLQRLLAIEMRKVARCKAMLRESDHRIKNSLQIVASLVGLQARRAGNVSVADALNAVATRITAVAQIHDSLQAGEGEDGVDLGDVIASMCLSLHAMAGEPELVTISVTAVPLRAPIAFAQPLVLAVNELVVNALRHAFPGERKGSIRVSVQMEDGELHIVVADDGVGLPPGPRDDSGFGGGLVKMMVQQVGGTLFTDSMNGARFRIVASVPEIGTARGARASQDRRESEFESDAADSANP